MEFDWAKYLDEYRTENAARIEAGLVIDPANAEVAWSYRPVTLEAEQGRSEWVPIYAARKPPNGPWIAFYDLDNPIQTVLWKRVVNGEMIRAGLYLISVDEPAARAQLIALRLQEEKERQALDQERIEAGKLIDPATAEMTWHYADAMDPYSDGFLDEPHASEGSCIGRERFARAPGGIWVNCGDLPDATREALWNDSKELMCPFGMPLEEWLMNVLDEPEPGEATRAPINHNAPCEPVTGEGSAAARSLTRALRTKLPEPLPGDPSPLLDQD